MMRCLSALTMFSGARPIDIWMLVIELLVVLLIAGELVHTIAHWLIRRSHIKIVLTMLERGQQLKVRDIELDSSIFPEKPSFRAELRSVTDDPREFLWPAVSLPICAHENARDVTESL